LVEDVLRQHMPELVPEQRPQLVGVEKLDELRRDEDDRPSRADRHRVRAKRKVGRVKLRELRQIERFAGALVDRPELR
jgi:hypothetical protein